MKATKYYIYSLEFPEGNIRYIGKTLDPKRRYWQHLHFISSKKEIKTLWIKSLLEEGNKPIIKIIDEVSDDFFNWEQFYILLYKSWGFDLLNRYAGGGKGGFCISSEIREDIIGKYKKFIEINKGHGGAFGKKSSEQKKEKLRCYRQNLSEDQSLASKSVLKFSLKGEFEERYPSINLGAQSEGLRVNRIIPSLKGKYDQVKGHIWLYEKEYKENPSILIERVNRICSSSKSKLNRYE